MALGGARLLLKESSTLLALGGAAVAPMSRCSRAPLEWPMPCTPRSSGTMNPCPLARSSPTHRSNFCNPHRSPVGPNALPSRACASAGHVTQLRRQGSLY